MRSSYHPSREHRHGRRSGYRDSYRAGADSPDTPGAWPHGGRAAGTRIALLTLLKADSPRTGYQLSQTLAERFPSRRLPGPALIYGTLRQLEDEGLVRAATTDGPGRAYELTEAGAAYLDQPGAPSAPSSTGLRRAVFAAAAAARQVGLTGDQDNSAKAAELLNETSKSLYRLLAGETE
jgi:DNA-binding PadR family transcriptional regulator